MVQSQRIASLFWMLVILTAELIPLSTATVMLYFGRKVKTAHELSSLYGISVRACEEECSVRPMCTAAVYHVLFRRCILYKSQVTSRDDIAKEKEAVTMTGFRTKVSAVQCGSAQYNQMEACTTKEGSERECKIEECRQPDDIILHRVFDSFHLGNMYHVGNKLVLSHGGQRLKTVCQPNGQWSHWESRYKPDRYDCSDVASDIRNDAQTFPFPVFFAHISALVYCDFVTDGGDWLVFQRRVDGSENFYRNWADYKAGFGNPAGEFWLGLDSLHTITKANSQGYKYELRIDMEDFDGEKRFAQYSTFYIDGSSDNYKLHVDGYTGDAGDSFTYHNGYQFSTYDRDNDMNTNDSCAEKYTGAWWYRKCHHSNLNGVYQPSGQTTKFAVNIIWLKWKGYHYSLKKTEMKIRRKE